MTRSFYWISAAAVVAGVIIYFHTGALWPFAVIGAGIAIGRLVKQALDGEQTPNGDGK